MKTDASKYSYPMEHGGQKHVRGWRIPMQRMVVAVLIFGMCVLLLNLYQLSLMRADHGGSSNWHAPVVEGGGWITGSRQPIVWIHGKRLHSGYLDHVYHVLDRIGYSRVESPGGNWDVLWAHDYPFSALKNELSSLKPYQKVNHFPGSGYVTNKLTLVTLHQFSFMPRAFRIPADKSAFQDYAKLYPDKMWVQKSNNHRGIKIKTIKELELDKDGTFVQEFVGDPYLIDGRRFDIGIYTVVTSIDPLRVYVFDNEWLIRFCPHEYHPFDPTDIAKYVITDDYMPIWKVPSLTNIYTKLDYHRKDTLFTFLKSDGKDPQGLREQIYSAIREVYINKEPQLIKSSSSFSSKRNFFELVRFDFVLDKDLKVYLMEVNMSPNLSTGHFTANKLLYQQVLFNMFSLVGVARAVGSDLRRGHNTDENDMQVHTKDIHTYPDICVSDLCKDNCRAQECKLCSDCLKTPQVSDLKDAYNEHSNRKGFRRVLPVPFKSQEEADQWQYENDDSFNELTPNNQWMAMWFRGKCILDASWCV